MKNTNAAVQSPQPPTGAGFIRRKIGNTVYRVSVHFSGTSMERLEDKIMRLAKNDLSDFISDFAENSLAYADKDDIMELPQTGRLLEGGSLA